MGAGIQPGIASAEVFNPQLAALEIPTVDVGDLQLPSSRRFQFLGDVQNAIVINIKAGHRVVRPGLLGFFYDAHRPVFGIYLQHPIALRILDVVVEARRSGFLWGRALHFFRQPVSVKNVVPENQGNVVGADELAADDEGLSQPLRPRLLRESELHSPLPTVPQQLLETGSVAGSRDDQNFSNPSQHQGADRVIDHRLVVNRKQLLAHHPGQRVESGSASAGQHNSLHRRPSLVFSRSHSAWNFCSATGNASGWCASSCCALSAFRPACWGRGAVSLASRNRVGISSALSKPKTSQRSLPNSTRLTTVAPQMFQMPVSLRSASSTSISATLAARLGETNWSSKSRTCCP